MGNNYIRLFYYVLSLSALSIDDANLAGIQACMMHGCLDA